MSDINIDINDNKKSEVFIDINNIERRTSDDCVFNIKGTFEFGSRNFLNLAVNNKGEVYGFPSLDKISNEKLISLIKNEIEKYKEKENNKCDEILNKV